MLTRKDLDKMSAPRVLILAAVQVFKYISYSITLYIIIFVILCIPYMVFQEVLKMNNKEYIEFTEKKLDQLNASSCKPYTITKHLNGLYNLSYGLDVVAWMLKPRELWQLINTLCILNILGGLKNDNMEA